MNECKTFIQPLQSFLLLIFERGINMFEKIKSKFNDFNAKHPIAKRVLIYGGLAVAFYVEGKVVYEKGLINGYKDMAETMFGWLHGEFPEEFHSIDVTIKNDPSKLFDKTLEKYMPENMKK